MTRGPGGVRPVPLRTVFTASGEHRKPECDIVADQKGKN